MIQKSIITIIIIACIGFVSANLQIQTNLENAAQTIKQIFVTDNGLLANESNTLVTINADGDGTVYVKNTLQTQGEVIFNGLDSQNNNPAYTILTIDGQNKIKKTLSASILSGVIQQNQREQTASTLTTDKRVGIGYIGENHEFRVSGNSVFRSGSNYIYLFPGNQFDSSIPGFTNHNNNLKINTKSGGALYINYDVSANTIINNGYVGIGNITPESSIDIDGETGYNQLRLRKSFIPSASNDTNGNIGDVARGTDSEGAYIFIKTEYGRMRATLESF